jgi:hypothetical protein
LLSISKAFARHSFYAFSEINQNQIKINFNSSRHLFAPEVRSKKLDVEPHGGFLNHLKICRKLLEAAPNYGLIKICRLDKVNFLKISKILA